jgi:thiol-disulfide isomerase/thioredoxin
MGSGTCLAVAEGEVFPNVTVNRHDQSAEAKDNKKVLGLPAMKGKVTVVNFWATWCEACKVEIAEMKSVFKPLLQKSDFNLAFVSLDKEPSKAVEWFKDNIVKKSAGDDTTNWMDKLFIDPEFTTADQLGIDAFPMTLVIDRTGKITKIQRGFTPGTQSTESLASTASNL